MSDFNITLFEACELLNRSKKSIGRYIRRGLLNPQRIKSQQGTLEYRFSRADLEAFKAQEAIVQGQTGQDIKDRTEQEVLEKVQKDEILEAELASAVGQVRLDQTGNGRRNNAQHFGTIKKDIKETIENHGYTEQARQDGARIDTQYKTRETGRDEEIIDLLKETKGLLVEQIKVKDEQIKDLSVKIDQLIERDRETNILLKGLQDKILLLEQAKPEEKAENIAFKENEESIRNYQKISENEEKTEPITVTPDGTGEVDASLVSENIEPIDYKPETVAKLVQEEVAESSKEPEMKPIKKGFFARLFSDDFFNM